MIRLVGLFADTIRRSYAMFSNNLQVFKTCCLYVQVLYGVQTQEARWRGCTSYTILMLGGAVGSLYVKEAFDETAKNTVTYGALMV